MERDDLSPEAVMPASAVFEAHPMAQLFVGLDGTILRANRVARAMLGADAHGQMVDVILEAGVVPQLSGVRVSQETEPGAAAVISVQGREWRCAAFPEGYLLVLPGTSTEVEVGSSNSQPALGQIMGSAAHEMNNPLAAISFRLEMMEQDASISDSFRGHLLKLSGQAQRLSTSVRSLQLLSGAPADPVVDFDLSQVCLDVQQLVRSMLSDVPIQLEGVEVVDVCGSAEQVSHAMKVLALHVARHTPGLSRLVLRVQVHEERALISVGGESSMDIEASPSRPRAQHAAANTVRLELEAARMVAEAHGAELERSRSPCGGLRATFSLPLARVVGQSSQLLDSAGTEPSQGATSLRVLVVEDEGDLSRLVGLLLASGGHEYTLVQTAEAALEVLTPEAAFDVILCDVRLPGLSGLDLLSALNKKGHPLARRVVLMSGFVRPEAISVAYLSKPFSRDDLMVALQSAAQG